MKNHLKNFFLTMCEPQNRENLHRLFWFSMLYRNRSGVVELVISREGSLADVRESRERRDKIFAEKTENTKILD